MTACSGQHRTDWVSDYASWGWDIVAKAEGFPDRIPLDQLRPNTAERLAETLRSWLLHQGQRDAVAADLFVHAQTVRYRMTQLRELYGERLNDPQEVLELIVALSIPTSAGSPTAS